ncbi:MAG: PQQ-dependent sugar dehydrogenase [Patescibacteria group bacterium]
MQKFTGAIPVLLIAAVIAIGAVILTRDSADPATTATATPTASTTEIVAEGLEVPWDIAFLSDSRALITERPGRVRLLEDGELQEEPVLTVETAQRGEGGLQGMTLDPDFEENRFVYLYVSEGSGDDLTNRVVRYRLTDDDRLADPRVLLDDIPGNNNHNGGRLRFGPDGKLYVTTGDAQNPDLAQSQGSLAGKILRMNPDGSAPADNPFGNLAWSYGHRNPQGLAWSEDGRLFSTEHGPSGEFGLCCRDELNRIERGGNYGWPLITGNQTRFGLGTPILTSGNDDTWAPASLTFWNGKLYFGALRGEHVHEITLENGGVAADRELFADEFGRIRTAAVGPDGALYLFTSNRDGRGEVQSGDDKLIRVNRLP